MSKKGFSKFFAFSKKLPVGHSKLEQNLLDLADEELMMRFKKGNAQAFQVLLARHQKGIYNFILKFIRSAETAEEVFQEVFLRVIRSADDYKTSAKFTTWLYTITRNYCIDKLRKEKFRNHLSLEQNIGDDSDSLTLKDKFSTDEQDAESLSRVQQLTDILHEILEELSVEQKEVFVLREFQNLSFDQIAELTKDSVNTVKSRMRYALKAIQKKFSERGIDSF